MVGPAVNLSARIMGCCLKMNIKILCDQKTFQYSKQRVHFKTSIQPVMVKGKQDMVAVFSPLEVMDVAISRNSETLVGRSEPFNNVSKLLTKFFRSFSKNQKFIEAIKSNELEKLPQSSSNLRKYAAIVIEGEAGIGTFA